MEDPLMAKGPSYRIPFRRRREGKTDYKARKALILSKLPRLVTRGSSRHMNVQIIQATPTGDEVVVSAKSQELRNRGWKTNCGNLPSAYLTGLLCGKKAIEKNVKNAVLDIGLVQPTKEARIFASVKGIVDAGVDVPYNVDKLPSDERIRGQHIVDYAEALSSNPELYEKAFSQYLKAKVPPEKIPSQFEILKKIILAPPKKQAKPKKPSKTKKAKKTAKSTTKKRRRKGTKG
jgi:large subunit ribosomal protein L18